ncbi:MAG: hypothetical protein KBF93_15335 [Leptospiraceae bacterium]|nr:hypothetical protein [Leptospiraceae bacterium]
MSQFLTIENGNHKLKDAPTGGGAAPYSEILVNFNLNEIQDSAFEKMSLYQFPTDTNNKLIEGYLLFCVNVISFPYWHLYGAINFGLINGNHTLTDIAFHSGLNVFGMQFLIKNNYLAALQKAFSLSVYQVRRFGNPVPTFNTLTEMNVFGKIKYRESALVI